MASKPSNHREGLSSSTVRPYSPSATEASWTSSSTDDDSVLREVEDYVAESREVNSIEILIDRDDSDKGSLVGEEMHGFVTSIVDALLIGISGDPNRPFFMTDVTTPRTRNRDIVLAYKEGHIDERWFDYLLLDINIRSSLPPPGYLPIFTRAFTPRMTLLVHPFVKDFYHHHGIFPT